MCCLVNFRYQGKSGWRDRLSDEAWKQWHTWTGKSFHSLFISVILFSTLQLSLLISQLFVSISPLSIYSLSHSLSVSHLHLSLMHSHFPHWYSFLCFHFDARLLFFLTSFDWLAGHDQEDAYLCGPSQPEPRRPPPVLPPHAPGHSPPGQHLPQLHLWTPWKPHLPQEPSLPSHPVSQQALLLRPPLHELPLSGPAGGWTAAGVDTVRGMKKR